MARWRRSNGLVVGRKIVVRNLSRHRRARVNYKRQQGKDNGKRLDEEIANQKQEEGEQAPQHPLDDRDFEAWLEEFYKLYKLSKFRRRIRDTKIRVDPNLPMAIPYYTCCMCDPSLADGYTHSRVPEERHGRTGGPPFVAHDTHNLKESPKRPEKKLVDQNKRSPAWTQTVKAKKPEAAKHADPSLADGYTHLSRTLREHTLNQGGTRSTPPMPTTNSSPAIRDNKFEVVLSLVAALLFVIGGCLALSLSSPEVNKALFAPIVCLFTAGYVVAILYDIISNSRLCALR